jgi:hypothetical protein
MRQFPIDDVEIGSTHCASEDPNFDLSDTGRGCCHFAVLQSSSRFFENHCMHKPL